MTDSSAPHPPHLTETQARQAFRGRHVLWMLIVSVGLAAIALAAAWAYRAHDLAAVDAASPRASGPAAAARPDATAPQGGNGPTAVQP
jgi:hypothetical protein